MSSPIIISLYCKGRQKDYEAFFTDQQSVLQFNVMIENEVIQFEGTLHEDFKVKPKAENELTSSQVDAALLEAVRLQLNQIFF